MTDIGLINFAIVKEFELTSLSPLLMHANDIKAQDKLIAWRKDSKNKALSVASDD